MSGTFDVGGTDTSTLVNTQSKEEKDTMTTTGEEDKKETANPSGDNYDSGDKDDNEDDNEDDDNNENSFEGEGEEGIQDSMKKIDEADEYNEKDKKDNKSAEGEDDKVISDGTKNNPKQKKPDVNTTSNENADNSDDIIPSENTQPEAESASITVSKMEMAQSETTNKSTATEIVQSSAIESMDISNTQNTKDGKKPAMKRRLGMGGPAFTKRTLQVKMQDISTDSDKSSTTPVTKEMKGGNKSVMRKLMCTKCPEMFFTLEGYQRHLFKDHKVRCFGKHLTQVIEKIVMRYSQETYETNYRVVNTKDSDKGGQPVTNTDRTSPQNDIAEVENEKKTVEENVNVNTKSGQEAKSNENDENIENIYVSSDGKSKKPRRGRKRKGKKSHLMSRKKKTLSDKGNEDTLSDKGNEEESESYRRLRVAMQNMYAFNKEEPTVKCIGCEIYFYSEDGIQTHFQHAHTNMKGIGIGVNNEAQTDATLKNVLPVETQNDLSQDHERGTVANVEDTEQSELPDIEPPTQTMTHGRKHSRNECYANIHNKKHSRGSPSPSKRRVQKDNNKTEMDTNPVTTNISAENLRRKKSEVSDDSSPTSKHFTRSHKTGIQTNDDDVTHAPVKQGKRKANSKDFQTKPIPEKKRKNAIDANEIIRTHTKKGVDDHEEETQQRTTQISKNSERKVYAT